MMYYQFTMEFSERIVRELDKKGWSRSEAARRGGISSSMFDKVINGYAEPGIKFLKGIAQAFGISLAEVLTWFEPPQTENDAEWEIWKAKLAKLTPENRKRFLRLMETELHYQEEQEERAATRKRKKTGPLPNLGG
jgi:transcriptional regulator with XRE-family HTH domain